MLPVYSTAPQTPIHKLNFLSTGHMSKMDDPFYHVKLCALKYGIMTIFATILFVVFRTRFFPVSVSFSVPAFVLCASPCLRLVREIRALTIIIPLSDEDLCGSKTIY